MPISSSQRHRWTHSDGPTPGLLDYPGTWTLRVLTESHHGITWMLSLPHKIGSVLLDPFGMLYRYRYCPIHGNIHPQVPSLARTAWSNLLAVAFNLLAMASNPIAMTSTLVAMASNPVALPTLFLGVRLKLEGFLDVETKSLAKIGDCAWCRLHFHGEPSFKRICVGPGTMKKMMSVRKSLSS